MNPPDHSPLEPADIFATVKEAHGAFVESEVLGGEGKSVVEPHLVLSASACQDAKGFEAFLRFLKDDPRLWYDLLSSLGAVDYPDRGVIEVVYCLDSTAHNHWLILKVALPRDGAEIPTAENVWRAADWHEREAWDLLGVRFKGHHNLVRILCAEDWVGHPLRKDYVIPDEYHGLKNVIY